MYTHIWDGTGWDEVEWVKLVTFLKKRKLMQDRARQGELNGREILTSLTEFDEKLYEVLSLVS